MQIHIYYLYIPLYKYGWQFSFHAKHILDTYFFLLILETLVKVVLIRFIHEFYHSTNIKCLLNVRHNGVLDKGIQKMNGIGLSSNEVMDFSLFPSFPLTV